MLTQSPDDILTTLFPHAAGSKSDQKTRASFQELVNQHRQIVLALESAPSKNPTKEIGNKHIGERDTLLRELIFQKLSGFYFLPSIAPHGSDQGHVVLLREIRHIPRDLAAKVGDGISAAEYVAACEEQPHFAGRLSFEREPFGMPVGLLSSRTLNI